MNFNKPTNTRPFLKQCTRARFMLCLFVLFFTPQHTFALNETVTCRGSYFLDVESSASEKDLLYCFVDSDDPDGFTITFDFDGTTAGLSNGATSQSLTTLYIIVPSNTDLASGLNHLEYGAGPTEITSSGTTVTLDGSGAFSITTDNLATADYTCGGGADLCTTSGLLIKIAASWSGSGDLFSGFYKEKINISIIGK